MQLVQPGLEHLPGYAAALRRGWNFIGDGSPAEQLAAISHSPATFLAQMDDPEAKGPPIRLSDGSMVTRLPSFHRFLWDGEFCGIIGLRWQPGTPALPVTCPGHIGYGVVPWKRLRGYATLALANILPDARRVGLPHVDVVTTAENVASQHVATANGGTLVESYRDPRLRDGALMLRFRIVL
jgi:predicted acetyltransferase